MQFMHTLFVYDEELKMAYRAMYFVYLTTNQKVATVAVRVYTCARICYIRSLVATLV